MNIIDKIKSFKDLEEDWDSYGAKCIEQDTIDRAIEFYELSINQLNKLPDPFVCPDCNGNIDFSWENNNKKLWLVIPEKKLEYFQYLKSDYSFKETKYINDSVYNKEEMLQILLDWINI
jgi:hypothetical protein